MKMKLVLSIAFSLLTASMLYALEFYDVSRPDIAKIKLNISAKNTFSGEFFARTG